MKFTWLKLLLLGTFVFWASGTAKFAHEALEHHGRDPSLADDDDDDDSSVAATPVTPAGQSPARDQSQHKSHPCPVCEMLAGMTVQHTTPPALPQVSGECIELLIVLDQQTPILHVQFVRLARGPPVQSLFA